MRYALCALRNFSSAVSISSPNLAPFASLRELSFLCYALCAMLYARFALICVNQRESAVKYLYFFRSPVVGGPAFAAYCHLPTVFLSGVADS